MGNQIKLRDDILIGDVEDFMRRETSKVLLRRCTVIRAIMIGHEVETIAEIMMVSKDYVYQTAQRFREGGLLGLEDKRHYNGRHKKLTNEDAMEIKKSCPKTVISAATQQHQKSSKS